MPKAFGFFIRLISAKGTVGPVALGAHLAQTSLAQAGQFLSGFLLAGFHLIAVLAGALLHAGGGLCPFAEVMPRSGKVIVGVAVAAVAGVGGVALLGAGGLSDHRLENQPP